MNDKEINSHIKSIPIKDWNRLFDLIPHITQSNIVDDFIDIMYELDLVVDFDWGNWAKGNEILMSNNFKNQDNPTLIKILTGIIRNDRFNEGGLVRAFENRTIEQILVQIQLNIIKI